MKLRSILEAAALYFPTPLWLPNKYNVYLPLSTPLQECVRVITPFAHMLVGHLEVSYPIELTDFSTLGQSDSGGAGPGATNSSSSLPHSPPVGWVMLVSSAVCCCGGCLLLRWLLWLLSLLWPFGLMCLRLWLLLWSIACLSPLSSRASYPAIHLSSVGWDTVSGCVSFAAASVTAVLPQEWALCDVMSFFFFFYINTRIRLRPWGDPWAP